MATTLSTVSKKMLTAVKSLKTVRDPSPVSEELSSLASEDLYLLKGIADSALTQAKQREEAEKEAIRRQELEKEDAENRIFEAMRPLPMYKDKSDKELKALIILMNQSAFRNTPNRKPKQRKQKAPKVASKPDGAAEMSSSENGGVTSNTRMTPTNDEEQLSNVQTY